jgi:segregation and condensation protein A
LTETNSFEEYSHFFEVSLDLFDGPIDLLLHLVKQNELPIEKVSLAEVTSQYLACIESFPNFDLEVAGEYLVIAATLVSIKSSVLLNEPVEMVPDAEGNMVDPHEELLKRLRLAEIYREGAGYLNDRTILGIDVFAPPPALDSIPPAPVVYKEHDPLLLGKAFRKLISQLKDPQSMTITVDSISIVDRMMRIIDILKASSEPLPFQKLLPDLTTRAAVISGFIALLELCKRHVINVRQDDSFEEIYISLSGHDYEKDLKNFSSEFDRPAHTENGQSGDKAAGAPGN